MGLFRTAVNINIALSKWFDSRLMPKCFLKDGNRDFIDNLAPKYIKKNAKVYDIGGGKHPLCSLIQKKELGLEVIGIDISREELHKAPKGVYDRIINQDIALVEGAEDGDIAVCQSLLEHVPDSRRAISSIASLLTVGGKALIFVPCRNALFARLNGLLPQKLKQAMLFSIYPHTRKGQGFPSYYHLCTPKELIEIAKQGGLELEEKRLYYISSYFQFMFPLYLVWRFYQLISWIFYREKMAETFSLVFVKVA